MANGMQKKDIEVLEKVKMALNEYLPPSQNSLFNEFSASCERIITSYTKRKQSYQKRADYYREYVKKWKQDNPEKNLKYQQDYRERKKAKKLAAINQYECENKPVEPSELSLVNEKE